MIGDERMQLPVSVASGTDYYDKCPCFTDHSTALSALSGS